MKLLNNLYEIKQQTIAESGFEYIISLDKEHSIYKAHFPNNPITPGVCIIQICKELMEAHTGESLFLSKLNNVKFLSIIDPRVADTVKFSFSKISFEDSIYKCAVLVHWETIQFSKLSMYLQRK